MENKLFGITIGDSSGVGPEILLRAFRGGEIVPRFVAYGDIAALDHYNNLLGCAVAIRAIKKPSEYRPGELNVIDAVNALLVHGTVVT